jgi:GNAT superfamily N-acetyltransferase
MRFDLDDALMDDILFCMENQEGDFLLDTHKGQIIDTNNNEYDDEPEPQPGLKSEGSPSDYNDGGRFIELPEWSPREGFRLMEKFTAGLKTPVLRHELSLALNRNKGVFRFFKNVIEQYPETEKLWLSYKDREMKRVVSAWYNALREEWGLAPIGGEPEDTSSLVLEDFVLREGKEADYEKASALHQLCVEEMKDEDSSAVFESINQCDFSGGFFITAETSNGDFSGFIYAVKDSCSCLQIRRLEVKPEYRGLGLGKTLLSKFLEKADEKHFPVTIDLPSGREYFSRTLLMEEFKPGVQKFVRVKAKKDETL